MQDLEEELDDLIADLKMQMEAACAADNEALDNGQPAIHKVKLLPQVMALLNRQNIQHAILDPETNFLQAVKFFLEPLNADGSLPAYNIQREIFTALTRLPVEKEALLSSGIGKVVLFYTKTKRAQPDIKRMAERLMGEWSRPILKRTDDYKKRFIATQNVDLRYALSWSPEIHAFFAQLTNVALVSSKTHHPNAVFRLLSPLPWPTGPQPHNREPSRPSPRSLLSAAPRPSHPSSQIPIVPALWACLSHTPLRLSATAWLLKEIIVPLVQVVWRHSVV